MGDNVRPHRSREVLAYLQTNTLTTLPWRAMSGFKSFGSHCSSGIGIGPSRTDFARTGSSITHGVAKLDHSSYLSLHRRVETQRRSRHPDTGRLHPVLNLIDYGCLLGNNDTQCDICFTHKSHSNVTNELSSCILKMRFSATNKK